VVEKSLSAVPRMRAASRTSSASTSQISATLSGGYCATVCLRASKPVVWSLTYASSYQPLATTSCRRPFMIAMLVPFLTARWTSALFAAGVGRGSTTTSLNGFGPSSLSSIRIHRTVCVSETLCPKRARVSQWSMSE
jgi:hypothetical protein